MTTPERLRRRQRRESAGIVLLAIGLVGASIYFNGQDDAQRRCISTYISVQSETNTIRANILERESVATRRAIRDGLSAQTREDVDAAKRAYTRALKSIDAAREAHPVQPFPKGVCD